MTLDTKKATLSGRPRLARYAPRDLARRAPSEGYEVAGPAIRIGAMQARQSRRGDGRFGEEDFSLECHQHGFLAIAVSQSRPNIGHWQVIHTKI
jgi:hypothetical protein